MENGIKLKDIAAAAGVSLPVVSDILNNKGGRFRTETRERIVRLAREMNYTPKFIGKALATGKSYNLGLLMPMRYTTTLSFHTLNIFHGLSVAVEQTDYNLVVFFGDGEKYFRKLNQGRIDGVVILQSETNDEVIRRTINTSLPTVIVNYDYDVSGLLNCACVRSDHERLMRDSFAQFVKRGRKRILSINDHAALNPNQLLLAAFNRECAAQVADGLFGSTITPTDQLADQLRNMFRSGQRWDGYFVVGYRCAELLLTVASEFELRINRDFTLIVADTEMKQIAADYSRYLQPQREMGRTAWQLMERLIAGKKLKENKILLPYRPAGELAAPGYFKSDQLWESGLATRKEKLQV